MLERARDTEAVRAGTPITVGPITLLPIERVVLNTNRDHRRVWISAHKQPYALIVCDAGGIRAIDRDGVAVSLEALHEKVPGLDTVLAAI